MQSAETTAWVPSIVLAFATTLAMTVASPATLVGGPTLRIDAVAAAAVTAATTYDGDSFDIEHASYLAWVIEHRRYDEIERAAAAIDSDSPHARWVPAAIGLAVEQLDATADAYGRMNRCSELGQFLRRIERAWPAGRAAMRAVSCDAPFVCGTYKHEMMKMYGGVAGYRRVDEMLKLQRFTELVIDIDRAAAKGDHANALANCAEIKHDGQMLATCVAEACLAGELAIAEVLSPYADARAFAACADAGVRFVGGFAYATHAKQPVELVHVHPDAPDGI